LAHLPERTPSQITGAGVSEVRIPDYLEAATKVELGGDLVSDGLILHETAFPCVSDGLLIETHRVQFSGLDTSNLRSYQGMFIQKSD
jgi:hypothetical protein